MSLRNQLKVAYAYLYNHWPRGPASQGVTVLLAHEISNYEQFLKLIEGLRSLQPFVTPVQFSEMLSGQLTLPGPAWLMTFDDGYQSSAAAIRKLEEKFQIRSAFFVVPEWVGLRGEQSHRFIRDNLRIKNPPLEDAVTWEELVDLRSRGHLIGSHSLSHLKLSAVDLPQELQRQILQSKQLLEEKLGAAIDWFAFPFGDIESIRPEAMRLIKQHYHFCFSGIRGVVQAGSSPWALCRQSLAMNGARALTIAEATGAFNSHYASARARLEGIVASG